MKKEKIICRNDDPVETLLLYCPLFGDSTNDEGIL